MGSRLFRVVVPDGELLALFTAQYEEFVYDSDALLGFQLVEGGGGLWSLVAGSGEVFARSRDKHEVFASLLSFVDQFTIPPPDDGVMRLAMRALVTIDGSAATLFGPSAFVFGTLVERRLAKNGLAIVDSRFVDVRTDGPTPALAAGNDHLPTRGRSSAHVPFGSIEAPVVRLVLPAAMGGEPSAAYVAAIIATATRSSSRAERLRSAWTIVSAAREIKAGGGDDLYRWIV